MGPWRAHRRGQSPQAERLIVPVRRAIGVIAKAPQPGAVKTRLCPPLDLWQAALLHGAFLRDTLTSALTIRDASVTLFHPPVADPRMLADLTPDGMARVAESGSGLGHAMRDAFQHLFSTGAHSAVLIGSDLPTLPAAHIDAAFTALERGSCDVVLGPAEDGGYYLIGLREPRPSLFERIDWSTDRVLEQTRDRARSAGLRVTHIGPWHDVDSPDDLRRLQAALKDNPSLPAHETRHVLSVIAGECNPAH